MLVSELMLRYSLSDDKEENSSGACRGLDDAACLPQALFQVDVLDGWEHGPSDVLGHLHHPLECLVVVY